MSPMMFLAGIPLASTVKETVDGQWNSSDSKVTSTEESRPKDAEFLTKSQLVQALVYMLKVCLKS